MAAQRDWYEKDYYSTLGVSKGATAKEITKAYRQLARENHPDTNPGNAAAEERFKEVSAAYDVLGDDKKRPEYDEIRRLGPMAGGRGGGGGAPGPGFGFGGADLGDLLGGLFGQRGGGGQGRRPTGAQRGADLETELHLSFDDAVGGITTSVGLVSDATCSVCSGSGASPGTRPERCGVCDGQGAVADNQGPFSLSRPCGTCGGSGQIIPSPCLSCTGSGIERRPRQVKVRLPAGVSDGQRVRLKGRGGPGQRGGPAGDLFVITRVGNHDLFGRRGDNLTLKVPVSYAEAALGADIPLPTMSGETVTLRLPAGTQSGQTLRVKGHGVPKSSKPGDLLATVEVTVPTELTKAQRKALDTFAAMVDEDPRPHFAVE